MAQTLNGLTRTSPASDPNVNEGQTFALTATKSFAGGGAVNAHDVKAEYSTDDANWNTITGVSALSHGSTNPLLNETDTTQESWTITANTAGTYYVRVVGDPNGGDNSYTVASTSQQVTVSSTTKTASGTPSIPQPTSDGAASRSAAAAPITAWR